MTASEPWVVDEPKPNPATTVVLDVEILTAAGNVAETTLVKATFESAIAILTLVRVSYPA